MCTTYRCAEIPSVWSALTSRGIISCVLLMGPGALHAVLMNLLNLSSSITEVGETTLLSFLEYIWHPAQFQLDSSGSLAYVLMHWKCVYVDLQHLKTQRAIVKIQCSQAFVNDIVYILSYVVFLSYREAAVHVCHGHCYIVAWGSSTTANMQHIKWCMVLQSYR